VAVHDTDDWQTWLRQHRAALFLMARQYLRTREEAEDAVQDGFIRFWKRKERAEDRVAYLFACVRSAALDQRRARLSRAAHDPPTGPLFATPKEGAERRERVEAAVAELSEDQREVLVMKIWGGLTFAQIAAALEIPMNTAASRYRYALEKLESLLAKEFKDA
jgi:RNA polymerase sigma-70 factor (ECF subfamily)